jgi:hypothetical protein
MTDRRHAARPQRATAHPHLTTGGSLNVPEGGSRRGFHRRVVRHSARPRLRRAVAAGGLRRDLGADTVAAQGWGGRQRVRHRRRERHRGPGPATPTLGRQGQGKLEWVVPGRGVPVFLRHLDATLAELVHHLRARHPVNQLCCSTGSSESSGPGYTSK